MSTTAEEIRYRCSILNITQISYGTLFRVINPITNTSLDLSADELDLLLFSNTLQTLNRHLEIYINRYNVKTEDISRLKSKIFECAQNHLLINENDLKKQLLSTETITPPINKPISLIGIVTRNRPKELANALESYIKNALNFGRQIEYAIADDSDGVFLKENQDLIAAYRKKYNVTIKHLTIEARNVLAEDLAQRKNIPADITNFILCGDPNDINHVGALRNSLFLYAKGKNILMTDDDTLCNIHIAPNFKSDSKGVLINSSAPKPDWFFDSFESVKSYFPEVEIDYLGAHEKLLGKQVASILNKKTINDVHFSTEIASLNSSLMLDIQKGTLLSKQVTITFPGIIGDSWMRVRLPTLIENNIHDHNLWGNSLEEYKKNKLTPYTARLSDEYTIYKGRDNIGLFAFDTSNPFPPFPPRGVNENANFGFLLDAYFPNYLRGNIPYAIEHKRPKSHVPDSNIINTFCATWTLTMIVMEKLYLNNPQQTPEQNITELGNRLIKFSENPIEATKHLVIEGVRERLSSFINYCRDLKAFHIKGPGYWHDDLDNFIKDFELILDNDTSILIPFFKDMKGETLSPFGWNEYHSWLRQWGTVLTQWSKLL